MFFALVSHLGDSAGSAALGFREFGNAGVRHCRTRDLFPEENPRLIGVSDRRGNKHKTLPRSFGRSFLQKTVV